MPDQQNASSDLSRRSFLGVGASALGGMLLAGCGGGGDTTAGGGNPTKAPSGGGKTISILDDNTNKIFKQSVIDAFTKKTGIKVARYEQANFNDLHDRLATAFRAQDSTFDVVMTWAAWSAEFGQAGWLEPLPRSEVPADVLPAALDAVSWNGKVYGLPKFASAQTMFYNKTLFRQAGLDPERPPASWDEFASAAAKLTSGDVFGYACDMGNTDGAYQNFIRTLLLNGGSFYGPDDKVTFNSPEGVDALSRLVGLLRTQKVMNPSSLQITNSSDLNTLFAGGQVGIVFNWPFQYAEAIKSGSKLDKRTVGNALIPGIKVRSASIDGSEGFAMNHFAKNKSAALEWLKFVTTPEVQRRMVAEEGWLPVTKSLLEDREVETDLPVVATYREESRFAIKRYGSPWYSKVVDDLSANITKAMLGQMSPKQALDGSAQNATDIISQYQSA